MRKGVEFWLRVAITLALVLLVIAAPSVLLPFIVSLVITILLNPVAGKVYALSQKYRLKWFPYDLAIIISFALLSRLFI